MKLIYQFLSLEYNITNSNYAIMSHDKVVVAHVTVNGCGHKVNKYVILIVFMGNICRLILLVASNSNIM